MIQDDSKLGVFKGVVMVTKKGLPTENTFTGDLTLRVGITGGRVLVLNKSTNKYFPKFNAKAGIKPGDLLEIEMMEEHFTVYGSSERTFNIKGTERKKTEYNGAVIVTEFEITDWKPAGTTMIDALANMDDSDQEVPLVQSTPSGTPIDGSTAGDLPGFLADAANA